MSQLQLRPNSLYVIARVLIAAFVGERLHFVHAKAFVARACAMLGVSADELVRRHGTGERRTAVRSDPLLLPGPKGGDA